MRKQKQDLELGDILYFHNGNFYGLTGKVIEINHNSNHPRAMYGYLHKVLLSNGSIGYIEKDEHWEYLRYITKYDIEDMKSLKTSNAQIYGELIEIGEIPPIADLGMENGKTMRCTCKDMAVARQLCKNVYEEIGVHGIAIWDDKHRITSFEIKGILDNEALAELKELVSQYATLSTK